MYTLHGVSGGFASVIAGGNFLDGFKQGTFTSALNHAMNHVLTKGDGTSTEDPPTKKAKTSKTITPYEVGVEWLTGEGPSHRDFVGGDYFTEELKKHEHISESKKLIKHDILSGQTKGSYEYKLGGIQGIGKDLKDYSTLLTFGNTGNLAVTYLGSYSLDWVMISKTTTSVTIEFTVYNSSSIQSAFRPPVVGYTEFWKSNIGPHVNSLIPQTGPMSTKTQTFIWRETLKLK